MKRVLDFVSYMDEAEYRTYSEFEVPDNPTPFVELFDNEDFDVINVHIIGVDKERNIPGEDIRSWGKIPGTWKEGEPYFIPPQLVVYAYYKRLSENHLLVLDIVIKPPFRT